jgi:hypothetical protein
MANLHNNLNSTIPDPNCTIPDSHSPHHSTATANGVGIGTNGNSTGIRHQPFHLSESMISINHSIAVKLTDTNFHTWKSAILPFINSYSLSRFLDASPPPSTITDNFWPGCSQSDLHNMAQTRPISFGVAPIICDRVYLVLGRFNHQLSRFLASS